MVQVNAMGDACPIPVVKTKKAIAALKGPDTVEVLVDNEIAVQNLSKMAVQSGWKVSSEKQDAAKFRVLIGVGELPQAQKPAEKTVCEPSRRGNTVVQFASRFMGTGDDELGKILMKGFIYALTQQEELPKTLLFYNSGAFLTCEGSESQQDLRSLEAQGVEILTCGTCLQHYGLKEKLAVGDVTNMYVITQKLSEASLVIRP